MPMLNRISSLFSNFRNMEIAFIFLIGVKLCFNSIVLLNYLGNDIPPQESIFPAVTKAYAQTETAAGKENAAVPEVESPPVPTGQEAPKIDINMLETIKKRNEELDARTTALNQREQELNMLQQTIEEKLQKMTAVQKKIEELLAAREDLIERSIKHLVKVYSSMKPNEAAGLIEKLDKDISIQILSKMKGKSAAKILEKMDPGAASDISDKIAKRK